jgi:DNA-binding beta-propeller fold protein YncE
MQPPCSIQVMGRDGICRRLAVGMAMRLDLDGTINLVPRFYEIRALTMDRHGNVFAADRTAKAITVIAPDGTFSFIAGDSLSYEARDGFGNAAGFSCLNGMVLDPDKGVLYVTDQHAVRQVTLKGRTTTLFGRFGTFGKGFAHAANPFAGTPCLNYPRGMALHDGHCYLADARNGAIRVFSQTEQSLFTLAGHPDHLETKDGPLGHFSPQVTPAECASLRNPVAIAFNPEGVCMVALEDSLVELEFPPFQAEPAVELDSCLPLKPSCTIQ